jgi:hypothetical protein
MSDEHYDEAETAQRRDEIVRRMIATPPQPRPAKPVESKRGAKPKTPKGQ